MVALGTILIVAGWWLLAEAMPPCQPARSRLLRVAGGGALTLSPGCYVLPIGLEQGAVFWMAALMLGALAIALVRAVVGRGNARHGPRRGAAE